MEEIFDTLENYKANYRQRLKSYREKIPNSTEKDFIEEEIKRHEMYADNTLIVRWADGTIKSVKSVDEGKPQVKQILDQFYDPLGNFFQEDVCKNLHLGFNSIIDYLRSKIITTTKLSNKSFALLTVVKQELKIIPRFQSGMREKELRELCDKEGYKYGSVRNHYMTIDSHGLKKYSDKFSDKHLADIQPYFKDNQRAIDLIKSLKQN